MKSIEDGQYLKGKLQWVMLFRVLIATFFLGIATVAQLRQSQSIITPHLVYLYILTGSAFVLTFIYAALLPIFRRFALFAYVQITIDMLFITALLFITGGVNSIFSFLYSISIISASICLFLPGGLFAATSASLLYAALIMLQSYHLISPLHLGDFTATGYQEEQRYFPLIVNISAFYIVALLSSFLTEQARKSRQQLHKKQFDIEQLENLHEKIIQHIPTGLLTLDHFRRVITFNRAAQDITGYSFDQAYQKNVEDIFPGITAGAAAPVAAAPGMASTAGFEMSFVRHDGKARWLGFSGASLKDGSNEEIGNILIFQDFTDFRNLQEQLKRVDRLAAVGRLAAGIAHEVRNPLASISGSIQVLQKSLRPNAADMRLMDIIIRESKNLSSLISDFTQYARTEAQSKEPVAVKAIADEVIDLFKNSDECRSGFSIRQRIPDGIATTANRQQLKQVLWNLLLNAAQAMHDRGGSITFSASAIKPGQEPAGLKKHSAELGAPSPAGWIEVAIADEGCGIAQTELANIFDPFFTTKDTGIGLGLAIVYKIIQEHNGLISVESHRDRGTTFAIFLPQSSAA